MVLLAKDVTRIALRSEGRVQAVKSTFHGRPNIVYRRSALRPQYRQHSSCSAPLCTSVASSVVVEDLEPDVDVANESAQGYGEDICPPTYVAATGRIVAIGDLHGDMKKAIRALQLAGVLRLDDGQPIWCGQDTVVVQLGDVMDRGDYEIAIIMLLRGLDIQAQKQGGAVYMLNGNHESLNICGDYRYVTEGAFLESSLAGGLSPKEAEDKRIRREARLALYAPGGPMAMELAKNPTVLVVNDTAFAHGGLLPLHVNYGIERMNREVSAWMKAEVLPDGGLATPPFLAMGGGKSVMWNRTLSRETFSTPFERQVACNALCMALERINAKRLVVGHTPQLAGVNCECGGKVWRVDVGMSEGVLDAKVQILEIRQTDGDDTEVAIVTEDSMYSTWSDEDSVLEAY